MMIELELDLAFNMFGKLDRKTRRRLRAVAMNPCQQTWDDAHCIILGHGFTTLWQAVLAVDPTFTRSKPLDEPWPLIPSQQIIVRAIEFATH